MVAPQNLRPPRHLHRRQRGRNNTAAEHRQPVNFHHDVADNVTHRVAVRICFHPDSDPDRHNGKPDTDGHYSAAEHRQPVSFRHKDADCLGHRVPVRIRLQSDGDPHRYDDKSDSEDDSDDDSAGRRGLHQPGLVVVNLQRRMVH